MSINSPNIKIVVAWSPFLLVMDEILGDSAKRSDTVLGGIIVIIVLLLFPHAFFIGPGMATHYVPALFMYIWIFCAWCFFLYFLPVYFCRIFYHSRVEFTLLFLYTGLAVLVVYLMNCQIRYWDTYFYIRSLKADVDIDLLDPFSPPCSSNLYYIRLFLTLI